MTKKNDKAVEHKENNELQEELSSCMQELQDWKEKFIRVTADMENYRRRVEKEKINWIQIAKADLLKGLLSIVDDFDRALQESEKQSSDIQTFIDGFAMISKSLYKFLESEGVTEITEIKQFDPNLHEAIVQIDSPDHASGQIVQVLQKGFMCKDKVLRPAKVSVAK